MATLTPKQEKFIDEYMPDRNGSAAAKRCGCSVRTARRYLEDPNVKAEIAARAAEERERLKIAKEDIIREVAAVAFATVSELRGGDKLKALELLCRLMGIDLDGKGDDAAENNLFAALNALREEEDEDGIREIQPETKDGGDLVDDEAKPEP